MSLPEFSLTMEEVEAILKENKGRTPPPFADAPISEHGGNIKVSWSEVRQIHNPNKKRIQNTLDRLSEAEDLPPLFLDLRSEGYIAAMSSPTGPAHPLVRIVIKRHTPVTVLWCGEVYR